jgi:cobaltochelatase CobS
MTATATAAAPAAQTPQEKNLATPQDGVRCELDGVWVHSIEFYLKVAHPNVTLEQYRRRFPTAQIESDHIRELRAIRAGGGANVMHATATVLPFNAPKGTTVLPFHEVLGMKASKAFQNAKGDPIMCPVMGEPDEFTRDFMPDVDANYVFQPELFKDLHMGFVLNIPTLAWGYHGTGKTTALEQYCARTKRPAIRVQHTVNTEEAHIVGQYVVKSRDGHAVTEFEPGPLAYAMKYGLVYIADEYDFALPSVTSVYQPVLEKKPLIIKEAPHEWRVVRPHPNFRIVATGNTNGSGDETGLYQGTQVMNAANYSRFGITVQVNYMEPSVETDVVRNQGGIHTDDAKMLVSFAGHVRAAYAKGDISMTVSPRELINAAVIGIAKGAQWRKGLELAYLNRLGTVDRKAVDDFAQRVFGGTSSK